MKTASLGTLPKKHRRDSPPASPMVATGKGKKKDDRLYGTPEKENKNPAGNAKRPPRTPEDAPPMKRNDAVPSIEKQINRQLTGLDQGSYTGGHMEMVSYEDDHAISEGTLKKWLIEESQNNAKKGPATPHRMGEPKQPKKKAEPKKPKLPTGGKTRIDDIMRIVRKDITNQFIENPRMMELSAGEVANRMESVALLLSLEAASLPSAVNHARNAAKKKNPQDA
ncbi:hypothetical protein SEMRO_227_G092450.1 [Seminavis robusta]|uniref:Uncharacterized protein n=1 Tax=Seminavis robusta TaxID=568900 RepID=A0A9N8H856_9STRA|nr:hypothetical protein SEMRO_227_G092450.1 [Seminavis robusta]|eukprot:Sro227_g092450.1 n/a (224) ;mRNA; r:81899-83039